LSNVKIVLLLGGVGFEFLGIILIASPDLVPYGLQFSRWLRNLTRPLFNRISRLLGRPRVVTIKVPATGEVNLAERVSLMKSAAGQRTLEKKVEFLLARDQEPQRDINALRARIEDFEIESSRQLPEPGRVIEASFEQTLRSALEEYRPLRIFGVIALVVGLACVTLANFIGSP
jgi:hypothetical protein